METGKSNVESFHRHAENKAVRKAMDELRKAMDEHLNRLERRIAELFRRWNLM